MYGANICTVATLLRHITLQYYQYDRGLHTGCCVPTGVRELRHTTVATICWDTERHPLQLLWAVWGAEQLRHESSSFSPLLQVLYRVKTLRREAHRTVVPVVALLYRRLRACFYVVLTIRQENQIRGTEREQPSSMAGSLHPQ